MQLSTPSPGRVSSLTEHATVPSPQPRFFIGLVAGCTALTAAAIDILLPAFPKIRKEFGLPAGSGRVSLLITAFFLGLALGQLFYGPLSDRFGRRRPLLVGLAIYIAGGVATTLATGFNSMIFWRFIWGLGAAAPRSLSIAMVRDTSDGESMARIMSLVMATFIVVPVMAPSVGSLLISVGPWRLVFWVAIVGAVLVAAWVRVIPETLPPERRRAIGPSALLDAFRVVARSRPTVGFGLAVTFLFATMSSWVGGSEIMIEDALGQGKHFALIFGMIAITFGFASLASARIVRQIGLNRLVHLGAFGVVITGAVALTVALTTDGRPPTWLFVGMMMIVLPSVAALVPSLNTAAMVPVPQVAGMAAAVLGTLSTAGGAILGAFVDNSLKSSITPFAIGALTFGILASASILLVAQPARRGFVATVPSRA